MRTPALVLVAFLSLASPALAVPPVPSYSVTPDPPVACAPASFVDTSTDLDGDIETVEWDFENDGTVDVTQDPATEPPTAVTHTYADGGPVTLRRVVTDSAGPPVEQLSPIVVEDNACPVAQFSFSPLAPVVGETVTFESLSLDRDLDGSIVAQAWDVDDDGIVEGTDPALSTSSLTQGTHTVVLTVTDNDSGIDTETHTVTVGAAPVPVNKNPVAQFGFSPLAPVVGETVTFESFSFDPDLDGSIVAQAWDVGDDGSVEGTDPTFSTASLPQGTHTVALR